MTVPAWLFWSMEVLLFASGFFNVVQAIVIRSMRKQAEVDAICNL